MEAKDKPLSVTLDFDLGDGPELIFAGKATAYARILNREFGSISLRFKVSDYVEFKWMGKTIAFLHLGRLTEGSFDFRGCLKLNPEKEVWSLSTEELSKKQPLTYDKFFYNKVDWHDMKSAWENIFMPGMAIAIQKLQREILAHKSKVRIINFD